MPIVSLVGLNLEKHVEHLADLIGTNGCLHSVEQDEHIFVSQLKQAKGLDGRYKLHYGEYWEELTRLLINSKIRSKTLYLDFDACCTLSSIISNHMDQIKKAVHAMKRQEMVWLAMTFSTRGGQKKCIWSNNPSILEVTRAWTGARMGWKLQTEFSMPYADGSPMCTVLMKFARD